MVTIKSYNDLIELGTDEQLRSKFIADAIEEHKSTARYRTALNAELYYKHLNPTIMNYEKFIYDHMGSKVPDVWSANAKIASNWYFYFVTQAVQFLLANGVSFGDANTKAKLGADFDQRVNELATAAKNGGVAFGFWNYDHLEVFPLADSDDHPGFVPLYDDDDGELKAGIRYWQAGSNKPLRATLYEIDGWTDYAQDNKKPMRAIDEKKSYTTVGRSSAFDGETVEPGENYPELPIIPLFNINRQSELVGNRGTLDAYDLMQSGLVNNICESEFVYWILKNSGGMSEVDDTEFIKRLKLTHVAHVDSDDGGNAEPHEVNVPYEASTVSLKSLEQQLFNDFMALKVTDIAAGSVTATQIQAAYEPITQKTDLFENQVTLFIMRLLRLVGIDDKPTYTRSKIVNVDSDINMILTAAPYLTDEYVTEKILTLLGDADMIDTVLQQKAQEQANRFTTVGGENDENA